MQPVASAGFTFIVNTTGDGGDAVVGDGVCETATGNGQCTLRAAIEESNAQSTDDTVTFNIPQTDPGYGGFSWTIDLASALPDLSTNIDIQGPGADLVSVRNSSASGFRILNVTSTGTVSVSGLFLYGGFLSSGNGGGVRNADKGTVNLVDCELEGNDVDPGNGGGVSNDSVGTVNLVNCTVGSSNAESGNGGGLSNESSGTVNVTNSMIVVNLAGARGGGITNQSIGTINVTYSYIGQNLANERGGGITNQSTGQINLTNSYISGNTAIDGGGIRQSGLGTVNVTNCTVAYNRATNAIGGGGMFNLSDGTFNVTNCTITQNIGQGLSNYASGLFNVKSSIVAVNRLNSSIGSGDANVFGSFSSKGFNLIGTTDRSDGFTQLTDQTGTSDSPLDPLLDTGNPVNGGPTVTMPLLPGSPAIDKGTSAGLTGDLRTDERGTGFLRTFDDPAIANATGGDGTDIGAFESQTALPTVKCLNISTRLVVGTGDNVLIGGFVITGNAPKSVLLRAIGPSLRNADPPVAGALADPVLELHEADGTVVTNDNWKDSDRQAITDTGIPPGDALESAILETLAPGSYTAIVSGNSNGTGVALIEAYDLEPESDSRLANISSRGKVEGGDDVIIGGFILGPDGLPNSSIVVRAIGPSLGSSGVIGALQDPTLELHDSGGNLIASDDNWKDNSVQAAELDADGLAPTDDHESAIATSLAPGAYTAIVSGKDGLTGIGLVEVYILE